MGKEARTTDTETTQSLLDEITRLRNTIINLKKLLNEKNTTEVHIESLNPERICLNDFASFAVEKLSDGAFLIAKDAGIIYVNQAACQQLGYTEDELLGMTIMDISPGLTQEIWDSIWGVTVSDKFQSIETEHLTKDGQLFPVEVLANFFEINGNQYSCSFTRDITKRKEMESRIRQAEKMKAVGQLAGGISHDFNNQLSGILGYADLLRHKLTDNPELMSYVDAIITAGQRSAGLTAQLLAFSRQGKYLSVPVDVHAIIDETVQMLERSIHKNIKIITQFEAPRAVTTGDPAQLENALLNLAINARDAMPTGGELVFSTSLIELDESFHAENIFDIRPGQYIQIRVTDTGEGMSREMLQRIFEPFFTTKEKGKGTGMGLASVYGAIKNHKGAVDVRSQIGKGTEIVLYLPSTYEEVSKIDENKENVSHFSARVLLVEDEMYVRNAVQKMLEALGCRVVTAENGMEAVEIYKTAFREFNLVILDIIMPGMGGKETFIRMRAINPDIVAIVASGYSDEGEVREILDEGVKRYIPKPFDSRGLAEALSATLDSKNNESKMR
jgi:two-component system cell cycle sensor histidine kinase/response regulator CckA